jgi:arylsulfatase A-like enzyme
MTAILLVVFDGLRPDMMRPDVTPNLLRFASSGTRFAAARSVFPSETRVATSSVSTGCHPRRHGLVANRLRHPLDETRWVDTGQVAACRALEQEMGGPLLEVPTWSECCAAAGRSFAVISSGSSGQAFLLAPRADELGQIRLSGHGAEACSAAGRRLLAELPPPPAAPTDRAVWAAEVVRARLLPDPPDVTVLWLCEPDTISHYGGLGSAAQHTALRAVDAAFGRILDDWRAGPSAERLQVIVASDHGHTTINGHVDVAAALAGVPELAGCRVLPGSSGGIVVPGGDAKQIAASADWLTRQDWVGMVLADDRADLPPGVLPRSAALVDHIRGAPVLYTLRTSPENAPSGLGGMSLYDGALAVGAGTHGGLSRAELATVLMLAGSRVRSGVSELPAGLIDIAPTALALLGIAGGEGMDGRVLTEALDAGAMPADAASPESWEAGRAGFSQVLGRMRMGRHVWLDAGSRR